MSVNVAHFNPKTLKKNWKIFGLFNSKSDIMEILLFSLKYCSQICFIYKSLGTLVGGLLDIV